MKFKHLVYIILCITFTLPSFAVSDKDMEQAKVAAAKLYLRWANNGSGYLDEINPSSMADLESKLKAQEKENLKDFNKVNIPSDYASWDKQRFVQFWGTTFFTSPALSADGKRAKDRVKAKVNAMNVSAPSETPKEDTKSEEPKKEEPAAENKDQNKNEVADEEAIVIPEPQEVVHQEEAIVDSMAMIQAEEESMALSNREEKAKSHTWIYVVILIVLVILVVWLMVYAANMMKKQGADGKAISGGSDKKTKKEIEALVSENDKLRAELSRLKRDLEDTKAENNRLRAGTSESRKPLRETYTQTAVATAAPVTPAAATLRREESVDKPQQTKIISEIFLGRANPKGLFVRGDRRPNPDHTIYRLDTKDGIVGTFRFADTPEAFAVSMSNPLHFLAGGCVSDNFEEAEGAARIITEAPGTAILENGCWKVLRKSKIRFE